jgi:hypothetical protein
MRSLRLRRLVGDRRGIGVALNSLALLRGRTGGSTSPRAGGRALALRRGLGDRRGIGGSLFALGCVALWGRSRPGGHLARESLVVGRTSAIGWDRVLPRGTRRSGIRPLQHARAARLLTAAADEQAAINAPVPPLDRERVERIMAALATYQNRRPRRER